MDHSGLMLAVRITLAHFSVSSPISLPNSVGESARAVPPSPASRACVIGSDSAALIAVLSFWTISAGVFFGTPIPYQPLAS
jgi:hypothetical protein